MSNEIHNQEPEVTEEDQAYMDGIPTRAEVITYVNNLLEQKYMPAIAADLQTIQVNTQLGLMAIQAILIQKGICTGEEIQEAIEAIIKAHGEQQNQEDADASETE